MRPVEERHFDQAQGLSHCDQVRQPSATQELQEGLERHGRGHKITNSLRGDSEMKRVFLSNEDLLTQEHPARRKGYRLKFRDKEQLGIKLLQPKAEDWVE